MIHHNMGLATQQQQHRARSTSPTGATDVLNHDPAASNFQRADGASRSVNKRIHICTYMIVKLEKSIVPSTRKLFFRPMCRMLYAELQFPSTSNYGSMKKRGGHRDKHRASSSAAPVHQHQHDPSAGDRHSNNTASTTVLSSAGEPSPPHSEDSHGGGGGANHNSILSQSVDNVHRYVPDYVAVGARKTAV